jgi:hypothetical protein
MRYVFAAAVVGLAPACSAPSGREQAESSVESGSIPGEDTEESATTSESGSQTEGDSNGATTDEGSAGGSIRFDVGPPDVQVDACSGGNAGNLSFSYIWIANSDQGTISKIDTQTLVEVGRYTVAPGGTRLPSRTSVNLSGDVAVANRSGGITKVYAEIQDCVESNGTAGIQSSTGPADILAWGEEECVAWHSAFNYTSQRPIAWTQGTYNPDTCAWEDQQVWTTGTTNSGSADVILLDGDDGTIADMITIQGLGGGNTYGGYGAVVDEEGNLWFNEMSFFGDQLVRVDIDDLSYQLIPTAGRSGYGIARDLEGRIWTCGEQAVNRYDPVAGTWASASNPGLTYGGCMVDGNGLLWVSGSNNPPYSFKAFDTDAVSEARSFSVPEHLHGVSIDFEGYVWGVGGVPGIGAGERAYRIDPVSGAYDTVEGLVGAYTYSDMTGFALVGSTPPPG